MSLEADHPFHGIDYHLSRESHIARAKTREVGKRESSKLDVCYQKRSPNHKRDHYRGDSDPTSNYFNKGHQEGQSNPKVNDSRGRNIQKTLPLTREHLKVQDQGEGSSWRPPTKRRSRQLQAQPAPTVRNNTSEELMKEKLLSEDGPGSTVLLDFDEIELAPHNKVKRRHHRAFHDPSNRQRGEMTVKAERKEDHDNPPGLSTLLGQNKSSIPLLTLQPFDVLHPLDQRVRDCQNILCIASRVGTDPDILCHTSVDVFLPRHQQKMEDLQSTGALKQTAKAQQRL